MDDTGGKRRDPQKPEDEVITDEALTVAAVGTLLCGAIFLFCWHSGGWRAWGCGPLALEVAGALLWSLVLSVRHRGENFEHLLGKDDTQRGNLVFASWWNGVSGLWLAAVSAPWAALLVAPAFIFVASCMTDRFDPPSTKEVSQPSNVRPSVVFLAQLAGFLIARLFLSGAISFEIR